ncbi:hypothetical protein LQ938_12640 [Microbacterium sp. cx-55]|uniref:hypothetical protein n=1 Tax=Microbacterium sp. cx-55 TaxID=2875948 RepID=UPI001CBCA68B|nr:hypothetical protein [Microbacterium sp. cx-55]MBZ4487884.1 hypothetical protein [Microbacterium sp. cx-55]UGB34705.1 hypothetical protein LQ938_12640 [Microbacterium sp. cx-55]
MRRTSVVREASAALLLVLGGGALIGALGIDYMTTQGLWVYTAWQVAGLVLIVTAAALSRPLFTHVSEWLAFLLGAVLWLGSRTWLILFLFLSPIPLVFWTLMATLSFTVSAMILAVRSEYLAAAVLAAIAAGSAGSTYVMVMGGVDASDDMYAPLAAGVLLGGAIYGVAVGRNSLSRYAVPSA